MSDRKKPKYADLADLEEDKRIMTIGSAVMQLPPGSSVAFVTDDDHDKAERYIRKLLERFPEVVVLKRLGGPVRGTVSVIVGRKAIFEEHPVNPKTELTDGSPVTSDHREVDPATGMQRGYVVLSQEERAKGFVRPVRRTYKHATCGGVTTMGISLAETYARDPKFYSGTFCAICRAHFPLDQFTWEPDGSGVGS